MTALDVMQLLAFVIPLALLIRPLGEYVAAVLERRRTFLDRVAGPIERACYRAARVDPDEDMAWPRYATAVMAFSAVCIAGLYALLQLQGLLPFGLGAAGLRPDTAFNAAISFASNTNWQSYAGERALGPGTQMLGMTVQNFASAAVGISAFAALARGLARTGRGLGSFWADLVRTVLYVLLPLSVVIALGLMSQGVVQSLSGPRTVALVEQGGPAGAPPLEQRLPLGPVASQVAIKQLGSNGGGYYNANSAHPFENPTPLSNWIEWLAILALPAALCVTFGRMIGDPRQGRALLAAMGLLFAFALGAALWAESAGQPRLAAAGAAQATHLWHGGGNLEGKETRFGMLGSVLWATATTAVSNGSVNAMHESLLPLTSLVAMALIQSGEVVFGGVGSGLYGMLGFAVLAVFMSGLMVGRTPEYLGKRIETREMRMAALIVLLPPLMTLLGTALGAATAAGRASVAAAGPHGFSEILYAFSSAANNNGSAFAGLGADTAFYNFALGIAMFAGRYGVIVPVLALAGSFAARHRTPPGPGTLPTHTPLFVIVLVTTIVLVGSLTFFPALSLGPIVEHLWLVAPGAAP